MQAERLKLLVEILKAEPDDPFNIYVLALEYQKFDLNEAKFYFDNLLVDYPNYLATYYFAGKLYADLEQFDEAISIYHKGIALAIASNKNKAEIELKRAFRALEDEMED